MDVREILNTSWGLVQDQLGKICSLRREITWKPDGSPVTSADIMLEKLLMEHLKSYVPSMAFVAEESHSLGSDLSAEWITVIDPIDGTENFCSGLKEWGVALSIWRGGVHMGSALMLPELNEILKSGDTLQKYQSRIVGTSSSYSDAIGHEIATNPESRIMGCSVYNMYNVIRGSYSRFVNPKGAYVWDLQAGAALALEYGCKITIEGKDYDGKFLSPAKRHRFDVRN